MKESADGIKYKEAQRRANIKYMKEKNSAEQLVAWLFSHNQTFETSKVDGQPRTLAEVASLVRQAVDLIAVLVNRNSYNSGFKTSDAIAMAYNGKVKEYVDSKLNTYEGLIKATLTNIANNKPMLAQLADWDAGVIRSVLSDLKKSNPEFKDNIGNLLGNLSAPKQQVEVPKTQEISLKSALSASADKKPPATTLSERAENLARQKKGITFAEDTTAEDKTVHKIKPRSS